MAGFWICRSWSRNVVLLIIQSLRVSLEICWEHRLTQWLLRWFPIVQLFMCARLCTCWWRYFCDHVMLHFTAQKRLFSQIFASSCNLSVQHSWSLVTYRTNAVLQLMRTLSVITVPNVMTVPTKLEYQLPSKSDSECWCYSGTSGFLTSVCSPPVKLPPPLKWFNYCSHWSRPLLVSPDLCCR